jgi:hypothetical protein
MRLVLLLMGCVAVAGCALFDDVDDGPHQVPVSVVTPTASCTDLWKHDADELQLINDDEANWQAHDDNAVQDLVQFSGTCNAADTRDAAANEWRCNALGDMYVREVGRMTKDDWT